MHALHYVEKSAGGRGQKGGLSAYAEAVGKDVRTLRTNRDAAEVAVKIGDNPHLLKKSDHLAAIHKLPQESWSIAVDAMLKHAWSAKDPGEVVEKIPQPAQPKSRDEAGKAAGVNLTNAHRAWSIKFAALN